uniref:Uncharacterized protein n=1 Tax=Inonotus obliquus TaxID=167356 RepID=A0A5A4UAA8_9AGAM|nr:hypothetical protein [Inonotus obliquus]BBN21304.1 hypothetical protein [Inonotus obliquus]
MKLKKIIFGLFVLVTTALFTLFIYNLLTNLDPDNLVSLTTQNNKVTIHNQISVRAVNNVASTIVNGTEDSTAIFNHEPDASTVKLIVGVSFGVAGAIAIAYLAFAFFYLPVEGIIENNIELDRLPVRN